MQADVVVASYETVRNEMIATLGAKTKLMKHTAPGRFGGPARSWNKQLRPACKLLFFRSPLLRLRWHRVVLDEAQEVACRS